MDKQVTYKTVTINNPGIYTIDDISSISHLNIENYNPNDIYIINVNDEFIYSIPNAPITNSEGDEVYCGRKNKYKNCSGNIIWNFRNARYIRTTTNNNYGHIIAPKAHVDLKSSHYPGIIIANSISAVDSNYNLAVDSSNNGLTAIQFYPYKLNKKISKNSVSTSTAIETELNKSDLYDGNYSIDELLKNYSVVTLGQKEYGTNTKLSTLTNIKGTASIFHIAGQFLINGNLGVSSVIYKSQNAGDRDGIRLDLKYVYGGNHSYIRRKLQSDAYRNHYVGWREGNVRPTVGARNNYPILYASYDNNIIKYSDNKPEKFITDSKYSFYYPSKIIMNSNNYIDFKTLYDTIVEQQKKIDSGTIVRPDDNNEIHIPIGGNYTIEGINETSRIVFDNYNENKDKLTIVTINDEGSINMPYESSDTWGNVSTNDWYGKSETTYASEVLKPETYYGNIVFNIPNAEYIKLASGNSFKGHIIAPNADVETPEMNFAGAMIVNSLYTEGHSEAHFYPLTVGSVGTGIKKETKTIGGEVEKIVISGTKTWDDNNNQDGLRPESVTINLLANGEKVDSVTITEKDNWEYSFNVPRVDDKGIKINYTITEDAIEHYSTKIESFSNDTCPSGCKVSIDGYNITNSYTPKKTSLTVNKVWKDENNADKLRPDSVEVELYANGKRVGSATVNEENNWTYIFNEIDMNENGKKIEYTVKEKEKIKGYTTSISGDQETGYTIINTHVVKKENPTTGDNIKKFLSISIMSLILLVGCVLIFTKYRNKKA